jgi:hypothetical protein
MAAWSVAEADTNLRGRGCHGCRHRSSGRTGAVVARGARGCRIHSQVLMLPGTGVDVVAVHAAPWRMRESPPSFLLRGGGGRRHMGVRDPQVEEREKRVGDEGSACAGVAACATVDRGGGRGYLRAASDGGGEGDGGVVGRRAAEQRLTRQRQRQARFAAPSEIQPPPGTGGAARVGREGRGAEGRGGEGRRPASKPATWRVRINPLLLVPKSK